VESVSLSSEETETIDWIITRHHYELPLETIICSPAQIEDLWNFTNDTIGEGYLGPERCISSTGCARKSCCFVMM
jgi:hypothetical protein